MDTVLQAILEGIENDVIVLKNFGEGLASMKALIGEVEEEVKKNTNNVMSSLSGFKAYVNSEEFKRKVISSAEEEIREKLSKMRKDLQFLESEKQARTAQLLINGYQKKKTSISSVSVASLTSEDIARNDEIEDFLSNSNYPISINSSNSKMTTPATPEVVKQSQVILEPTVRRQEQSKQRYDPSEDWWRKDGPEYEEHDKIDWPRELAEREEMKFCLVIKEGWKRVNTSFEELESILRTWTGRATPWFTDKCGHAKNGKAMFTVRFESEEDRNKLFEKRKEIATEGSLLIGESLAYVERKERWRMLKMFEKLNAEGRLVEFENKKIKVDGEWWRYQWTEGWKKQL